ncbi:hypothetical protein BCU25_016275 [Vibrio cyclitrophicus]|nr:hypothetical protein [Vibrio cyclitrophicus]PMJ34159.1 hypothetical protein BCU25_09550 [Vibrio cyclitrophicus]
MNDINLEAKEALKMAREAQAIATKLNEETKERMAQTRQMHDAMLISQRRVCYAFSTLLPKPHQGDFLTVISPEALEDEAKSILEQVSKRQESDVINTIVNLALANSDVIQIHVNVASIEDVSVQVYKLGDMKKYNYRNVPCLLHESVEFDVRFSKDNETALGQLLRLEDKLIDLIAEAREASETKAEVEA